jgi:non-ribosomal peptide synthase protein (TIGR01720 family)
MFRQVTESVEEAEDPQAPPTHMLEVSAQIVNDQLRTRWRFSTDRHRRETVSKLVASFANEIQLVTRHIIDALDSSPTPEDFPHSGLAQGDLDKVLARAVHRMRHKQ